MTGGPPRVEVLEASVRFGPRVALDGVHLAVAAGAVVAVLGPSGSGKSTLLRAVTGLQPLDAGRVLLDGQDQAGVPVHRRAVGLMFQDQALFPHRDVEGNVAFGLRMQGLDARSTTRRVGELLELVGLPGMGHRPVQELSGGEQQRVALARALAPAPRLLLLDEPLGALDRTLRDRLVADLRHLFADQALTVVSVTHDQAEAFALADRIAVMDGGRVVQAGAPADVWRRPRTEAVARLLGQRNLLPATVRAGRAETGWGTVAVAGRPGEGGAEAPVPDGPAVLLVRPDGITPDPAGPVEAVVRLATFLGTRTVLELAGPGDAPVLHAEVPSDSAPARGARLRVRIDPTAVVALPPVADPPSVDP